MGPHFTKGLTISCDNLIFSAAVPLKVLSGCVICIHFNTGDPPKGAKGALAPSWHLKICKSTYIVGKEIKKSENVSVGPLNKMRSGLLMVMP